MIKKHTFKIQAHDLRRVYKMMRDSFGPQKWWPAETSMEMMIGAILTQNTAWTNVEKAIANLKRARRLSFKKLHHIDVRQLARLIQPAGYFNVKARRIKNFIRFIHEEYGGSVKKMLLADGEMLRGQLLGVNGIGQETADSILVYAAKKPFFVIDAYTKRIFSRHHLLGQKADYMAWQKMFEQALPKSVNLYNDFHAQIVKTAKEYCKTVMHCEGCPLNQV